MASAHASVPSFLPSSCVPLGPCCDPVPWTCPLDALGSWCASSPLLAVSCPCATSTATSTTTDAYSSNGAFCGASTHDRGEIETIRVSWAKGNGATLLWRIAFEPLMWKTSRWTMSRGDSRVIRSEDDQTASCNTTAAGSYRLPCGKFVGIRGGQDSTFHDPDRCEYLGRLRLCFQC